MKACRKQIALFNQKYPPIKVNVQSQGGFDRLAVTFAAGTAPDMFFQSVSSGYAFIGHGDALSLAPYIRADKTWQDDMSKSVKAICSGGPGVGRAARR
jgi:ABC-type glycerol-3-phosphate transport system substrate-binding protein